MQTAPQSNAMAEIALALAMAFFSVLVLTMVSMGAGFAEGAQDVLAVRKSLPVRASADSGGTAQGQASEAVSRDSLVIFYQGRFFDGSLAAIDSQANHQASLLAVEPSLSLSEAMAAREMLGIEDLAVTTLDPRWIEALEGRPQ